MLNYGHGHDPEAVGVQCGQTAAFTAAGSAATWVPSESGLIPFPKAFAEPPLVIVCLQSGSGAAGMGAVTAAVADGSVTEEGFRARVYNNGSERTPYLNWIAIGKMY